MGVHKQCVEDVVEVCSGKKRGKRASAFIPVLNTSRKPSNPNQQAGMFLWPTCQLQSPCINTHLSTSRKPSNPNQQAGMFL